MQREYPRRLDQLLTGPGTDWRPRILHPAFYGSYDWHSAVHMHWLLVRLLRLYPALPGVAQLLEQHLSPEVMTTELKFFHGAGGATFERPYGWAWLLELQAELLRLRAGKWSDALNPLAAEIARRFEQYLRGSPYPVRSGAHGNTAFACVLALDYAIVAQNAALELAIRDTAIRWYAADRDAPVAYEPSADDFLSPALTEAVLMTQVLPGDEWLNGFLPADLGPLAQPPLVADHTDAKQSHLDGLCLSRAWCFQRLGYAELARRHLDAGLPQVVGGDYVGEHWLASFAALALGDQP